ncbi:DNA polymerase III subunit gamma/tau [Photobacterium sp. TY1-4]|uniref:DNA polymerase III subunit gamma/tau n=1 Tax=Photobacterium sp. TY1-4 TaxID=2899122 RepID=UPI0021C22A39|nr:DNA polymerase III subunit gamma/tau [Photobacterium sp. TY1-4]UXI02050.1 DNA polymerase III subunit gamma/tau [Photobacterium sp. TY1-4]
MSYQVLARKWRPHQFSDVVGQSHVLTALGNALEHNRLHHAYLFSGTRGVGKTTIARIFAKGLNCEQGITATPCGQCETCREIDDGRFVDLLEIDAASRTKVEDTRELLDNVQYKPARGRFKVYLIDEVHMLSRHSFNALLKTLEEPPEYVKFILATTDPQKLPVTILSRCLQFHLKHLDNTQIQTQLEHVLRQEAVDFEPRALSLLARAAEGSMRDALSLTDQAIALGNGQVQAESVSAMLGTLNTDQALYLLEAMAAGEAQPAMACLEELAGVGVAWDSLLQELAAQLHRVAMVQALPASLDATAPDAERVMGLSKQVSPQEVQLCYQIALQGRQDLAYAPDGRTGLEMVLLRMLAFRPVASGGITPQVVSVPASEPAPAQSGATMAHSGQGQPAMSAPAPSPQAMQRVQALKSQMSGHPAQSGPEPVAPEMMAQGQMQPPVQSSMQPSTQPSTQPSMSPQAMPPQAMPDQPVAPEAGMIPPGQPARSVQQPMPSPSQPAQHTSSQPSSAASGLLAARNTLRSQAKRGQDGQPAVKKGQPAPAKKVATNVLDRIASKHSGQPAPAHGASAMPASPAVESPQPVEQEYRWQPLSQPEPAAKKAEVAPAELKRALEHEKTPEMAKLLVKEAANQDSWSDLVTRLDVGRMVQQLALNSALAREESQVTLFLRPSQKHLDTPKARDQLAQALSALYEAPIELSIELSDKGRSPLEWREAIYQQKLDQAKQSLHTDPNVTFICQRFSAVLDEESVRPL